MPTATPDPNFAGLKNDKGVRTDEWRFNVTSCTSQKQALDTVAASYPVGYPHPDYGAVGLQVEKMAISKVVSPNSAYEVALFWSTPQGGSFPSTPTDAASLLALPPRVESVDWYFYQVPWEVDKFGKPMINSSGDPWDPSDTLERSGAIIVLSKYKETYVADTYATYFGMLNSAAITLPSIGLCSPRTVRAMTVKPAPGFNATTTFIVGSVSGTFTNGQAITWPGGGSATVVTLSGSSLIVMNPSKSIGNGVAITGPSGSCTTTAAVALMPVKCFWTFDLRYDGFDLKRIDKGFRGFASDGTTSELVEIHVKRGFELPSTPVLLRQGAPSVPTNYTSGNPKFVTWVTSEDRLLSRVTANEVVRDTVGDIDFITFKKIADVSFAGIGL